MPRTKMRPIALLAAAALILSACGDVVSPTPSAGMRPGGPRLSVPGPSGITCLDESIVRGGAIDFTPSQMNFHGYSRNQCWSGGYVHVQADLHWGIVSACSQEVPKMITGYGDNRPQYNFYENPAPNSLDVYRTHARPTGSGYLKAKMVRMHRFWHSGVGAYGGPYTEYNEVTERCDSLPPPPPPPPPSTPFTALSLDSCTQAECWYSQTIWSCVNMTHTATPTGTGPFTYQWQDGTTGTTNSYVVCPYSNGENSYRDVWVTVTDLDANGDGVQGGSTDRVIISRMIHWTFYNGNGGGSCLECA